MARTLYVVFEYPFVLGSGGGVAALTRGLAGRVRSLQTGLVRTYVLAVAASLAVMAVVFIAVR